MLVKDKDILIEKEEEKTKELKTINTGISGAHMREAWGDAFDYYLRGITSRYLQFGGRATRLEFWGYATVGTLLYIPLYALGLYADMPLLPYYYGLATLIPTAAVMSRRLHDIHRKATWRLAGFVVLCLLGLFINYYILAAAALWGIWLVSLFSRNTAMEESDFFGEMSVNDEIYEEDNERIIKKFRTIALMMALVWAGMTVVTFDDWSRQATLKATNERIFEEIAKRGAAAQLTPDQIRKAEQDIRAFLRSGVQVMSEDALNAKIDAIIKAAKPIVPEEKAAE